MKNEDIFLSKSQAAQDIFVYFMLNSNDGYFLDIGSYDPIKINNTYLLEKKGWNGLCIDVTDYTNQYSVLRTCEFTCKDLMRYNINDVLSENNVPELIDYISFDVDIATFKVLNDFDFNKYKFKVMTFEHDLYSGGGNKRKLSREILLKHGYKLLCSDICNDNNPFEDWWVNTNYIDENIYRLLECDQKEWNYIYDIIKNNIKDEN